jgi:SnoaL-like protein
MLPRRSIVDESDVHPAADLVLRYLRLVEERDLDAAAELLGSTPRITFPGGRVFTNLDDQVASSSGRFRSVRKSFDSVDIAGVGDDVVVYVAGTLAGLGPDGTEFAGVRFLDRFVVSDGLIIEQMVWNDLAETGVVAVRAAGFSRFDEGNAAT